MASTRLQNPATGASVASERKTLTFSVWVKRSTVGSGDHAIIEGRASGDNFAHVMFNSDGFLRVRQYDGTSPIYIQTNRRFRDTSAWYHIVVGIDTTQATSSDRVKIWVNGVQETSFSTATYPSQNFNTYFGMTSGGDGYPMYIGDSGGGDKYFSGSMSDFYGVGGQQYDADVFGETDANGVWKPNTSPSITYGTGVAGNFHLKFDDTSNFGRNYATGFTSNSWSVNNGTMTNTKDNPSNVFATLNPLVSITDAPTFSNGNNSIVISNAGAFGSQSTLGMSSGKYYAEFKMTASSDNDMAVGVNSDGNAPRNDNGVGFGSNSTGYRETGNLAVNGTDDIAYGDSYAVNDIVGIAIDLDNNKLYFSKNGTWQNSGDPTSGATGTGALSLTSASSTNSGFYFFNPSCHSGTQGGTWQCNFGNGYFGTTAVASAGTNASGIGIFEYDVPTGYTALSTKGLNL